MAFNVPLWLPVSGSRPSAIRLLRSDSSLSTSGEMVLLFRSLVSDAAQDVLLSCPRG